ncbi:NADH oxidase [Halobacteriovorax marinus]|uniref:NADH oxidase n=1 Tax=Halobacteriovorax marinus TaxID=97084 RepID=A0A1Y5F7L8_9BACT|nr:NADH oxidase [Halobacteriovorax marinus]
MVDKNSNLVLRSGHTIKNRFGKSAMSENMATNFLPKENFVNAYSAWANGGVGLCITGNVMIDRDHLGEFNNVVLDDQVKDLTLFSKWAQAGKANDTTLVMQLNHPGKQTPKFLTNVPVAPSAISFPPPMSSMFNTPRELTEDEIVDIVKKFATASILAKEAGFDGVQIHGAHGYLVSQFLSGKHNQRSDRWGGSLENRMRFLMEIYKEIRKAVGVKFIVGVKLNSADFQKGGFTEEESMEVVKTLDKLGMDFIEISGGTYEVSAMMGKEIKKDKSKKESTQKREAYFINYARKINEFIETPLMVTGGFRTSETIKEALGSGHVDIVGMGRPYTVYPDLANRFIKDEGFVLEIAPKKTGIKILDAAIPLEITWYTQQIHRLGKKKSPRPNRNVWLSLVETIFELGTQGLKRTRG